MNQDPSKSKGVWPKMIQAVAQEYSGRGGVAVGVSGGADSVALAEALWRVGANPEIWHFNHRWRGRWAVADAAWVRRWAEKRKLRFRLGRARKAGRTGEGEAREGRWAFFVEQAQRSKVRELWLGHQEDDQAETVLMQLLRGAGPDGLAGISQRSKRGKLTIIRPWLRISRKKIREGAEEVGLNWREDATNEDRRGWRSRVRHQIFPYLEKVYGRDVKGVLGRTAEIFAGEKEYWETEIGKIPIHPDVREWRKKPLAWQRRAIRCWLMDRGYSGPSWGEIEGVRKLVQGGATLKAQLRGNTGVGRSRNKLFWIKKMGLIAKGKPKC